MRKATMLLSLLLILSASHIQAQDTLKGQQTLKQLNQRGMLSLGSWSVLNLATGIYGNIQSESEVVKRFHQMNWMWNTVNFSLATSSLLTIKKYDELETPNEVIDQNKKLQRLFLINSGLDVLYIGAGATAWSLSSNSAKPDLVKGYGQSLVLQGGFLLVFDGVMYLLNRRLEKNAELLTASIELVPNGLRLRF